MLPKDPSKIAAYRESLKRAAETRVVSDATRKKMQTSALKTWRDPVYVKDQKDRNTGVLNPNYKPKVEKICPACDGIFFVKPSHADQECCSKECMGVMKSERQIGENNSFFNKTHTPEVCEIIRECRTDTHHSLATRKKMSAKKKDVPFTKEHSENIGKALKNREITWADKISASHQGLTLDEWEGFITPLYLKIRASQQYDTWRRAVFERDDFRDWFSGIKGNGNLNAHHVVPFAEILKQYNIQTFEEALKCGALWNISNGVTMIDTNHAAYHAMWG
jgi:hypothetical protein